MKQPKNIAHLFVVTFNVHIARIALHLPPPALELQPGSLGAEVGVVQ